MGRASTEHSTYGDRVGHDPAADRCSPTRVHPAANPGWRTESVAGRGDLAGFHSPDRVIRYIPGAEAKLTTGAGHPNHASSPLESPEAVTVRCGLDAVEQTLSSILSTALPYSFMGDCEAFARVLGQRAVHWLQEVEQRRIRGYVLVPEDQVAPRAATERVRFFRTARPSRTVCIIQGDDCHLISFEEPTRIYTARDPAYTAMVHSCFWAIWESSAATLPVQPPAKHDYLGVPDTAARSSWAVTDAMADEIRRTQRTTYVLNLDCVRRQYLQFRDLLPDVRIMYSIKTNPDPRVLGLLRSLGSGFEAASFDEVELAAAAGAKADNIIFSTPVKKRADIRRCREAGVTVFTADSGEEIDKIAREAPGTKILLRIHTPGARSAVIDLATKYGAAPGQVLPLLRRIRAAGLQPHGLTFNVGGQNEVASAWEQSLDTVHALMAVANDEGFDLRAINVGGGFPIPVHPFVPDFESIAHKLGGALGGFDYLAEPGRIVVADAGKLITPVVGRTVRNGRVWLYVDASLFGSLQMMDRHGFYFPATTDHVSIDVDDYAIASISCDGRDVIAQHCILPEGIKEGHLLTFHFLGAYSLPLFNIAYGGTTKADMRYLD